MSTITSDTGYWSVVPEWVLDAEVSDRAVRLYGVLGRYADTDGSAHPSRKVLAGRLRCSVDSIDRATKELEAIGALRVVPRYDDVGDRTSNEYVLCRVRPGSRTEAVTGGREVAAVNQSQFEPDTPLTPQGGRQVDVNDRKRKHRRPPDDDDPSFAAFWQSFPRRTAKGRARTAWARAVDKYPAEQIVAAAAAFAADRNLPPPQFVPHPATWLNDERWHDGPLPPRSENGNGHGPVDTSYLVVE